MKKRLLITSALMTAVLGASLATGTYAWYQVAAGGVSLAAEQSGSVSTGVDGGSVDAIELSAVFSEKEDKVALTKGTDGKAYMYDAGGTIVEYNGTLDLFDVVTLTISGTNETDWSSIAGTYTVTVTAGGAAKVVAGAATDAKDSSGYDTTATATVVINQWGIGTTALNEGNASDSVELSFTYVVRGQDEVETNVVGSLTASIA